MATAAAVAVSKRDAIDRRLAVQVATLHGIPLAQAAAIVKLVIEAVRIDLRKCHDVLAVADPDLAMGVRTAMARLGWALERLPG